MMGWWHGFGWGPGFGSGYGPGFSNGFGSTWGIAGVMLTLLFWGVVIVLAFLAVRAFVHSQRRAGNSYGGAYTGPAVPADSGVLAVLKERYARGEITRAEYEEVRHALGV